MGTPNVSGRYEGNYDIAVRSEPGIVQAYSGPADGGRGSVRWAFDFNSNPKTVTLDGGRLTPAPGLPMPWFKYKTKASGSGGPALPLIDNGDGTYTVPSYVWQVFPLGIPFGPFARTSITLEISLLTNASLAVTTMLGPDGLPGMPLPSPPFPRRATPDWRGYASRL